MTPAAYAALRIAGGAVSTYGRQQPVLVCRSDHVVGVAADGSIAAGSATRACAGRLAAALAPHGQPAHACSLAGHSCSGSPHCSKSQNVHMHSLTAEYYIMISLRLGAVVESM